MSPPTIGPATGTTTAGRLTVAISRPSERPPAAWMSSVVRTGISMPPPTPWTTRNTTRLPMFQARPQATEPARNTASEASQVALAPNLLMAHPLSGMTMPKESR